NRPDQQISPDSSEKGMQRVHSILNPRSRRKTIPMGSDALRTQRSPGNIPRICRQNVPTSPWKKRSSLYRRHSNLQRYTGRSSPTLTRSLRYHEERQGLREKEEVLLRARQGSLPRTLRISRRHHNQSTKDRSGQELATDPKPEAIE